ncbi:MAG: hypothetical protein AB7E52_07260 [Bdellovibrionales bacterium]
MKSGASLLHFKLAFLSTIREPAIIGTVFLLYAIIMIIYVSIFHMIAPEILDKYALTHDRMTWYMGVTEFVLFTCSSWGMKEVQAAFLSGQIDLALLRPYPDSFSRIAEWGGISLARTLLMAPLAFVLLVWLGGWPTFSLLHFIGLLLSLPLASFMMLCATYMIGGSCLWFVQSEPAFWVWQKSLFLFGAMVWPACLYPDWMHAFIYFPPFPAILMIAGDWTLSMDWPHYLIALAHQILWAAAFSLLVQRFDRMALRHIQKGGA